VDDPARFGRTAERLDYLFSFPGLLYAQHVASSEVVIEQWAAGRDMSDHYGIIATIDTTVEAFPAEREIPFVLIGLHRFHCLQTTSRPGKDEVTFTLTAKTAKGELFTLSSGEIEDVSAGTRYIFDLEPLRLPDPGDELALSIEGREKDDLSANDSLGRTRRVFERDELLALVGQGRVLLAFPVLHGDGAEYVVEIELLSS
jgi:hypothetical protein